MVAIVFNDYIFAGLKIIFAILFGKVIHIILSVYLHKAAKNTKTTLDDELLKILTRPFYVIVIAGGIQAALSGLKEIIWLMPLLNGIFFVIYALLIAFVATKVFTLLISHWLHVQKRIEKTPKLISKVVAVVIYAITILVILAHFKIEINPLIATLGVGGLAVGLALQGTLANLFAGLHILSDKPIVVGNFIELDNKLTGNVEDISWRATRIKTLSDDIVIIPNSKLADSIIINYSLPDETTSCGVKCFVSYNSDLDKVEKVALEVAQKIQNTAEGAVPGHEPVVRFNEFGESNINFNVFLKVKSCPDKYRVTHTFMKAFKKALDANKLEISYPVVKVITVK